MTTSPPDRLDRIEAILFRISDRLEGVQQLAERNRDDISVLIEGQTRLQNVQIESAQTQAQIGQTQELLAQNLIELRAGQERQERILDYLVRRDGERQ